MQRLNIQLISVARHAIASSREKVNFNALYMRYNYYRQSNKNKLRKKKTKISLPIRLNKKIKNFSFSNWCISVSNLLRTCNFSKELVNKNQRLS